MSGPLRQAQFQKAARRIAMLFPEHLVIETRNVDRDLRAEQLAEADREFRTQRYRLWKETPIAGVYQSFEACARMANQETILKILEEEL